MEILLSICVLLAISAAVVLGLGCQLLQQKRKMSRPKSEGRHSSTDRGGGKRRAKRCSRKAHQRRSLGCAEHSRGLSFLRRSK